MNRWTLLLMLRKSTIFCNLWKYKIYFGLKKKLNFSLFFVYFSVFVVSKPQTSDKKFFLLYQQKYLEKSSEMIYSDKKSSKTYFTFFPYFEAYVHLCCRARARTRTEKMLTERLGGIAELWLDQVTVIPSYCNSKFLEDRFTGRPSY